MRTVEAIPSLVQAWRRCSRPARAACLIFVTVSLLVTVWGRGQRSGWILMTSPAGADHRANSLLGYCFLHGGEPFMKENISHAAQVGVFCGSLDALTLSEFREDFRLLRGLYSLLASIAAPLLGVIPAMLMLNWLSWALCAGVAWRLTRDVFQSELAALLAVMLVCGGMGMTVHIGDYSPHLLAFATYYAGIWLVYRSRVYCERRPWGTHLWLGLYFAVACLAYNTGVMLVGVYLLTAIRRNHPLHLGLGTIVALSARPLWQAALGLRVADVEAQYLDQSLDRWWALSQRSLFDTATTVGGWLSENVFFFDSPLVVLAGLACCAAARVPASLRWLGWVAVAVPLLASLVFTPVASARGYLVYAASLWLYACLAAQMAGWLTSQRRGLRWTAGMAVVVLMTSHCVWSTAHLANWLGPVKTYFLGWDNGVDYLMNPATQVFSLTDQEPTPVLFGGNASLERAGAYVSPAHHRLDYSQVSFGIALLARGWFFGYFALLAVAMPTTLGQRASWLTAVVALYIASCAGASRMLREVPAFFPVDRAIVLEPRQTLRYQVSLGPRFLKALRQNLSEGDAMVVLMGGPAFFNSHHRDVNVSLYAGEEPLAVGYEDRGTFTLRGPALRQAWAQLSTVPELAVEVSNLSPNPTWLAGWQRQGLSRRHCTYLDGRPSDGAGPEVLPIVELRVVQPNGRIRVAGF